MAKFSTLLQVVIVVIATLSTIESRKLGIVGGKSATINGFPYQLAYLSNGKLKCGASLIGKLCALTAGELQLKACNQPDYCAVKLIQFIGHCTAQYSTNITLRAGSTLKDEGGRISFRIQTLTESNFIMTLLCSSSHSPSSLRVKSKR